MIRNKQFCNLTINIFSQNGRHALHLILRIGFNNTQMSLYNLAPTVPCIRKLDIKSVLNGEDVLTGSRINMTRCLRRHNMDLLPSVLRRLRNLEAFTFEGHDWESNDIEVEFWYELFRHKGIKHLSLSKIRSHVWLEEIGFRPLRYHDCTGSVDWDLETLELSNILCYPLLNGTIIDACAKTLKRLLLNEVTITRYSGLSTELSTYRPPRFPILEHATLDGLYCNMTMPQLLARTPRFSEHCHLCGPLPARITSIITPTRSAPNLQRLYTTERLELFRLCQPILHLNDKALTAFGMDYTSFTDHINRPAMAIPVGRFPKLRQIEIYANLRAQYHHNTHSLPAYFRTVFGNIAHNLTSVSLSLKPMNGILHDQYAEIFALLVSLERLRLRGTGTDRLEDLEHRILAGILVPCRKLRILAIEDDTMGPFEDPKMTDEERAFFVSEHKVRQRTDAGICSMNYPSRLLELEWMYIGQHCVEAVSKGARRIVRVGERMAPEVAEKELNRVFGTLSVSSIH
jgi:hypothetical protein